MKVQRREFIGLTVGAAAGIAVGNSGARVFTNILSSADSPYYPPRGHETFVLSVCGMCPGGCGIRVRRIGDRVVKLEGNPLHPVNGGHLCIKGQAAIQSLYHPDRLPGPMRRVGPRGSIDSFEKVTWEKAIGEIAARLRSLREARRPESLVLLRGGSERAGARVAQRFLQAFGSPNDLGVMRGDEAAAMALMLVQGIRTPPAYDLQSCDYVLSLGSAMLEASSSPVHMTRAYGAFRQGRTGRRGKFVHVGSRLSITGAAADEWIAIRRGSEATLALGVAAVLVAEGLYDREFVTENTGGIEDSRDEHGAIRRGLRSLLERDYGLERVSSETGVSVNVILRIAREFAAARRSLAIGPRQGPLLPGRLSVHLAAQVLNALSGNVDSPGGVLVPEPVPFRAWPDLASDPVAVAGRAKPRIDGAGGNDSPLLASDPERLADALFAGSPYPVDVLMILDADPAFTLARPDHFAAAIGKVPMVVSFASLPDDTALFADWILPQSHFLESWDLCSTPSGVPYSVVGLAQPALPKPLHDVRPLAEIFLELARQVAPELAAALPWKDLPALARWEMDGLYEARRGAVMGTQFDEAWVRMMENSGWWAPGYRSADELWRRAQETGGWWDPFYDYGDWRRVFRTPTGRYEFPCATLDKIPATATTASDSLVGSGPGRLDLLLFEPLPLAGGSGAEYPFLQTMLDPGHEERWETWAEINPETAVGIGVKDRSWIRLSTSSGSIVARARVTQRVVPGIVAVPLGLGRRGGGRWAFGVGANPLRLLLEERDPLSALPDFEATVVQVTPAGDVGSAEAASRRV